MSATEQDLRDLLAERSADAPAAPARISGVQHKVRRQRRRELAMAMAAVGILAIAGASIVQHASGGEPSPQPASPAPTATTQPSPLGPAPEPYPHSQRDQTHSAIVDGLRITTSGPHQIAGTGHYPFTVRVSLTNTTTTTWRGTVGVGLYGPTADDYFGSGQFLYSIDPSTHGCCIEADHWFTHTLMTPPAYAFWIQGIADPGQHQIRPGQTTTLQITIVEPADGQPHHAIRGWIPVLNPLDPGTAVPNPQMHYPSPTSYSTVDWG